MTDCTVINIFDMIDAIGEDSVNLILSEFSCPKNSEIENFVKNNAVDFAKRKLSVTHFIINSSGEICAVFTLTHKALEIERSALTNSLEKKIKRYAQLSDDNRNYTVSAFLIAQFGKNYDVSENISGDMLMSSAITVLKNVQREIGGGIVYLECEEKPQLLNFYQNKNNCFRIFGDRFSVTDNVKYIQLLKLF